MNPDTIIESLQTGFRVAVGATASAIEMLQDSQKRDENFSKLNSPDWTKITEELAEKGEATEQEARQFVENMLNQQTSSPNSSESAEAPSSNPSTSSSPTSDTETQTELHELTEQVAALRAELEKLQEQESES